MPSEEFMTEKELSIPEPIPFGDVTDSEAEFNDVLLGDAPAALPPRTNPEGVERRFYVPIGIQIRQQKLIEAARLGAGTDTWAGLQRMLDDLEAAVITEDGVKVTKSGNPGGTQYLELIGKFRTWLRDPLGSEPPCTIFSKGNKKLPFWQFVTLPGVTCPGAGECLAKGGTEFGEPDWKKGWCYSFSAWRYPVAFFRQLQNTLLMRMEDKSPIERDALAKFEPGQAVRLYVDGDFDSLATLEYWMHFVERFPENRFYGYSKSWGIFAQWHAKHGGRWPENYLLNLSGGTKSEARWMAEGRPDLFDAEVRRMMSLKHPDTGRPVARGTFRPVRSDIPSPKPTKAEMDAGVRSTTKAKFEAFRQSALANYTGEGRPFVCPGNCGMCLPGGRHACGSRDFEGVPIIVGFVAEKGKTGAA